MILRAITICINYSDYLRCILANRKHFDRWLIATVPDDVETLRVCEEVGLESLVSACHEPGGIGFHAAWNKSAMINEAIGRLQEDVPEGAPAEDLWVVVLDADTHLPSDFRERLERQELDPDFLYGLEGRRICEGREIFDHEVEREPWTTLLERHRSVIGYFNLFNLSQPRRYPDDPPHPRSGHNDWFFWMSFTSAKTRHLPMNSLHLGGVAKNWGGRVEAVYGSDGPSAREAGTPETQFAQLVAVAAESCSGRETVVQIGYYRGDVTRELSAKFSRVVLVDHWGIDEASEDAMMAEDRRFLAQRFRHEIAGLENVEFARVDPETPYRADAICVCATPTYEFLFTEMPRWSRQLGPGAVIFGESYGLPACPDSTHAIELLLGTPDQLCGENGWIRIVSDATAEADSSRTYPLPIPIAVSEPERLRECEEAGFGVVLLSYQGGDNQQELLALAALRESWSGAVCVIRYGAEVPALRVACARYGAGYLPLVRPEAALEISDEEMDEKASRGKVANLYPLDDSGARVLALSRSPFEKTLMIRPEFVGGVEFGEWRDALEGGDLVVGAWGDQDRAGVRSWREQVNTLMNGWKKAGLLPKGTALPIFADGIIPELSIVAASSACAEAFGRWHEAVARASEQRLPGADLVAVLAEWETLGGSAVVMPADVTPADRGEVELRLLRVFNARVHLPEDATLVIAVAKEDLDKFERNWLASRYSADVPVILYAIDFPVEELTPIAGERDGVEILSLGEEAQGRVSQEPYWTAVIVDVAPRVKTSRWLYLDPLMHPLPGANLYMGSDRSPGKAPVGPGWVFVRDGDAIVRYTKLGPPATLFDSAFSRQAAAAFLADDKGLTFERFVSGFAATAGVEPDAYDPLRNGWT